MLFNHEYQKRLRVGFIGAGEHSFRNILPCFQYLPIELVAMADHHPERGLPIARQFGAKRFYPNHEAMLAKEAGNLDAVLIVAFKPDDPAGYPSVCKGRFEVGDEVFHALEEPTSLNTLELLPRLKQIGVAALKIEGDTTARTAVSAALERSERASLGEAAQFTWGEALLNQLAAMPAGRWTFLVLSMLLAAALLFFGPHPVGERVSR